MGQTLTDVTAGGGVRFNYILAIEALEYLICDLPDPNDAIGTFSGTDWSQAVNGLRVLGGWSQSLRPWDPGVEVGQLTFAVSKGITDGAFESDVIAERMFGAANGVETFLSSEAAVAASGTITVKSTAQFDSSGTAFLGTEAFTYTGVTATTFTGVTRGKWSPFNRNGATGMARMHRVAATSDNVRIAPKVTSRQRDWKGRWVGLWMKSSNSTSKADCQLVWAGQIAGIRDGVDGQTYIDCEHALVALKNCELLRDQMVATVAEGVYLKAGDRFSATDRKGSTPKVANDLVVVASGASGSNEINAGRYTIDEVASILNDWLASEGNPVTDRLSLQWTITPAVETESGIRSSITWTDGDSTSAGNWARISMPPDVMEFFGFTPTGTTSNQAYKQNAWDDGDADTLYSNEEPYRTLLSGTIDELLTIDFDDTVGKFFDNRASLPPWFGSLSSGSQWGVFQLGDSGGPMALFERVTDTQFKGGLATWQLDALSGTPWQGALGTFEGFYRRVKYSAGVLKMRQVGLVSGSMLNVITKMLASTGTAAYNHATYDAYPHQLSAAIPWDLLGSNWTSSLQALDSEGATITVLVEKPKKLLNAIGTEFVARVAQVIWKNQGLKVASWGTPTAARALHSFTEANKAAPSDTRDINRTVTNETDDFLVNRIRLNYGRKGKDLINHITIVDAASQDQYGQHSKEIDLYNAFNNDQGTFPVEYDMTNTLTAMMPFFSRPMRILKRTISLPHYESCAPGDFCTVTDSYARDPATGARGLSSKPGLIVKHSVDWGGDDRPMHGEIDVLILPLSNIAPYSPCAEVNRLASNGGYDSGTSTLTCESHSHSESSETADPLQFEAGDSIVIVEQDPATFSSPLTWSRTVVSSTSTTIVFSGGTLTSWDSAKRYRVISAAYGSAATTQKADVYQADDSDNRIVDTADAYVYGTDLTQAGTWTDSTGLEQVALYSNVGYGDGKPLDTGYERDLARLANNVRNYRTAVIAPTLYQNVMNKSSVTGGKAILAVIPICLQPGALFIGDRTLYIRPWYRSNDGTSVTLTVSLCRQPPHGTSLEIGDADAPVYKLGKPFQSKTWTTTSTTWAAGAATAFTCSIADGFTGEAYLVLETNSTKLETRGLAEVWQAAYDEAA